MNNHHSPKTNYHYLITDLVVLTVVFLFILWFLHDTIKVNLSEHIIPFIVFSAIWLIIGVIINKYKTVNGQTFSKKTVLITLSDLFAIIITLALFKLWSPDHLSLNFLIKLSGITYLTEIILVIFLFSFIRSIKIDWEEDQAKLSTHKEIYRECEVLDEEKQQQLRKDIVEEAGEEVLTYLHENIDLKSSGNFIFSTVKSNYLESLKEDSYNVLVNLRMINDIRYINRFFEILNRKLTYGGVFIGCAETLEMRKQRLLKKIPLPFNYMYYFFDFMLNRVAPKYFLTRKLYYYITSGSKQVISKAEIFGRLYSCGFEIMNDRVIDGSLYWIAKKIDLPHCANDAYYGAVVRLKRIGKDGRRFYLYKLRSMHPYAEYLQEYVYNNNHLEKGGKFRNDFRVSTLGRWLRRYWIDEIPNLVNVIGGDMKLVGVRPVSEHYFNLYTKELQQRRIKYKPGLLPPFSADTPGTIEEIMASELKYLDAYDKHPFLTDWRYFWKILYSILVKRARSN